ncbi:hypothetical protein F383_38541 [Gossypium arboreum]|uniref:Uncharacterized protein n=1 Tax=Gossypium arboreum TaxID=29729 RepID=A0A0B0MBP1_GOSAR|nr:hypothetical protein F383_38541 [Gossypium arboreum]
MPKLHVSPIVWSYVLKPPDISNKFAK